MPDFGEIINASSMRDWTLSGRNGLVKVMSPAGESAMWQEARKDKDLGGPGNSLLSGYFTLEKYLWGKTASQIEALLGLRTGELCQMARVYSFRRLPRIDEFDFRFSAAQVGGEFPDQSAPDAAVKHVLRSREDVAAGRHSYARSQVPVADAYKPGSDQVLQWQLRKGTKVPCGPRIATVTEQLVFPRPNLGVSPYRPANGKPL